MTGWAGLSHRTHMRDVNEESRREATGLLRSRLRTAAVDALVAAAAAVGRGGAELVLVGATTRRGHALEGAAVAGGAAEPVAALVPGRACPALGLTRRKHPEAAQVVGLELLPVQVERRVARVLAGR